jgi:uncharacterized protein DUF4031
MPVYIDKAAIGFRRMIMSHMIADTLEELHEMAALIGMKREWFQPKSFPHYDVAKGRRVRALTYGAIECDRRTFVMHLRRIRDGGSEATGEA